MPTILVVELWESPLHSGRVSLVVVDHSTEENVHGRCRERTNPGMLEYGKGSSSMQVLVTQYNGDV